MRGCLDLSQGDPSGRTCSGKTMYSNAKRPPLRAAVLFKQGREPRKSIIVIEKTSVLGRPGSDLLFQALRLSTIGAEEFNGRVRYGNGFRPLARTTRSAKDGKCKLAFCVQPFPRLIP